MPAWSTGGHAWTLPEPMMDGDEAAFEPDWQVEWGGELVSPFAVEPTTWLERGQPTDAGAVPEVPLAVRLLIGGGVQDENRLTDLIFHARHPELGGRKIRPGEHALAHQWSEIRTGLIRPLLRQAASPAPATGPVSPPVPTRPAPAPGQSVTHWQQRALHVARIDPARWKPDDELESNRPIFERVYKYYTILFNRNENLLWAGMAKLAGGEVYHGLDEAQAYIKVARNSWVSGSSLALELMAQRARELQIHLLRMQQAIFNDLAWQHQAFVEAGLTELEATRVTGAKVPIDAWRNIASGDPGRVRQGNRMLLRREQEVIVAPGYAAIRAMVDFDRVPAQMSDTARSPIPGGRPFRDVVPGGDLTLFHDRWKWLETDMLPKYEQLTPQRRRQLVNTPLTDLSDHRWPPG